MRIVTRIAKVGVGVKMRTRIDANKGLLLLRLICMVVVALKPLIVMFAWPKELAPDSKNQPSPTIGEMILKMIPKIKAQTKKMTMTMTVTMTMKPTKMNPMPSLPLALLPPSTLREV
jgi:hypothetical protein